MFNFSLYYDVRYLCIAIEEWGEIREKSKIY
jgi:hypothetical protein